MNTINDYKIAIFDKENYVKQLNVEIRELYQKLSALMESEKSQPKKAAPKSE